MKPLSWAMVAGLVLGLVAGVIAAHSAGLKSSAPGGLDPNETWVLPKRDQVNEGTVTILSAPVGGITAILMSDLARVLDNDQLRVLQVVGKGPVQNVIDILDLKSIDMGAVVSDVPEFYKLQYNVPDIASRLRYIAKLYDNELHIIAPTSIKTVFDLAGKKVMAPKDVGFYAAKSVFARLNIRCTFDVQTDDMLGLQTVVNGAADAWIVSTGKVMPIARNLKNEDGRLHLVSVPYDTRLQDLYLPSSLTSDDYPNLIPQGQKVETLAAGVLLITYNWPENTDRYNRVAKFVDAFFSRIGEFDKPPRNPKWREASISARVPGWERFKAAQDWLDLHQGSTASRSQGPEDFKEFLSQQSGVSRNNLSDAELTKLYNAFLEWKRNQR
jgi:TRAP-type uncharacterized transport system substrate-binding protein